MPAPIFDDLKGFLNVDEFATPAVLVMGEERREIVGIFDLVPLDVSIGASDFDASGPRFTTASEHVSDVTRGHRIEIADEVYSALGHPQHDGTGMAVIRLAPAGANLRSRHV